MTVSPKQLAFSLLGCVALSACTQTTPSAMNLSPVELAAETAIEQIPADQANDAFITVLAEEVHRFGTGPLTLAMIYDPKSRDYTARSAVKELQAMEVKLKRKGIRNIRTETVATEGADPILMVSYDRVQAQAPSDCATMPGLNDNNTTRFLDGEDKDTQYRFGCGIETMIAQQIYRPADLQGREGIDDGDGRRAANIIEHYRNVSAEEAEAELETLGREDLGTSN